MERHPGPHDLPGHVLQNALCISRSKFHDPASPPTCHFPYRISGTKHGRTFRFESGTERIKHRTNILPEALRYDPARDGPRDMGSSMRSEICGEKPLQRPPPGGRLRGWEKACPGIGYKSITFSRVTHFQARFCYRPSRGPLALFVPVFKILKVLRVMG